MATFLLLILAGFQIKHFVADYLLQPHWVIAAKASLTKPGGYVHVGIHALGSLVILLVAGVSLFVTAWLVVAEAIVHYLIDYTKARWSLARPADVTKASYWAAHGTDQLMHQLTYAVMIFVVLKTVADF